MTSEALSKVSPPAPGPSLPTIRGPWRPFLPWLIVVALVVGLVTGNVLHSDSDLRDEVTPEGTGKLPGGSSARDWGAK